MPPILAELDFEKMRQHSELTWAAPSSNLSAQAMQVIMIAPGSHGQMIDSTLLHRMW